MSSWVWFPSASVNSEQFSIGPRHCVFQNVLCCKRPTGQMHTYGRSCLGSCDIPLCLLVGLRMRFSRVGLGREPAGSEGLCVFHSRRNYQVFLQGGVHFPSIAWKIARLYRQAQGLASSRLLTNLF